LRTNCEISRAHCHILTLMSRQGDKTMLTR